MNVLLFATMMTRINIFALCMVSTAMSLNVHSTPESPATSSFQIQKFNVPDAPQSAVIIRKKDLIVEAHYVDQSESHAHFSFMRAGGRAGEIEIANLANPNGWFSFAPNGNSFTITWSDGGAIGNFHTRLFTFDPKGMLIEKSVPVESVIADFQKRHYCKARGDNFLTVRWLSDKQILIEASVYATGDCGRDLGYTDRYVVSFPNGRIQQRVHVPESKL